MQHSLCCDTRAAHLVVSNPHKVSGFPFTVKYPRAMMQMQWLPCVAEPSTEAVPRSTVGGSPYLDYLRRLGPVLFSRCHTSAPQRRVAEGRQTGGLASVWRTSSPRHRQRFDPRRLKRLLGDHLFVHRQREQAVVDVELITRPPEHLGEQLEIRLGRRVLGQSVEHGLDRSDEARIVAVELVTHEFEADAVERQGPWVDRLRFGGQFGLRRGERLAVARPAELDLI